jgi:carboxypeptidase family protein
VKGALNMTSSTLRAAGCVLLAFSASVFVNAQTQPKKRSSISGKVSLKGNGLSGVSVRAISQGPNTGGRRNFGAVTDSQGNYRISDLPRGNYELTPVTPQFVIAGASDMKQVILEDGENLEGIDFTLLRGGVITGKVTNAEGQPVIEEQINIEVPEGFRQSQPVLRLNMYSYQTDDRGVYRIFGLEPGKYTVSTGTGQPGAGVRGGVKYKQTYYPSVTDSSQAKVIEVTEGSEITNVDIVVSAGQALYSVSGRVIDGDTGRPIPNARFSIARIEENGSWGTSGPTANGLGEFRIENLIAGKYMLSLDRVPNDALAGTNSYADSLRFEITDHDVTDVVMKASKGGTVSGVVVFEGVDPKTVREKYGELMIMAFLPRDDRYARGRRAAPVNVGADGTFTAGGLPAGEVQLMIFVRSAGDSGRQVEVARVERDGVAQQRNIVEIKEREQVTGVRVIATASTGILQGIVKIENGRVEPGRLYLSLVRPGEKNGYGVPLDVRGRFRLGGLRAGNYDLIAYAQVGDSQPKMSKQQIVITDDQVTEVTLTLDLSSAGPPAPDRP